MDELRKRIRRAPSLQADVVAGWWRFPDRQGEMGIFIILERPSSCDLPRGFVG
jgi:hypothetical protein